MKMRRFTRGQKRAIRVVVEDAAMQAVRIAIRELARQGLLTSSAPAFSTAVTTLATPSLPVSDRIH